LEKGNEDSNYFSGSGFDDLLCAGLAYGKKAHGTRQIQVVSSESASAGRFAYFIPGAFAVGGVTDIPQQNVHAIIDGMHVNLSCGAIWGDGAPDYSRARTTPISRAIRYGFIALISAAKSIGSSTATPAVGRPEAHRRTS
jgi:hypothetical protein